MKKTWKRLCTGFLALATVVIKKYRRPYRQLHGLRLCTPGISLPRTAQAQYDATQHLPLSQAKAGDLVFFHSTYNAGSYVTHVGIYVGNNQMYHAGDPIGYADLSSSYWQQHLIGAGRVKQ